MVDITLALVLDREHFDELRDRVRGWLAFHPELRDLQWLLLAEDAQIASDASALLAPLDVVHRVAMWASPPAVRQWTQRERALWQYLVEVPHLVTTRRWLKIDTDAVAGPHCSGDGWMTDRGFAVVAPPWGYTKPAGTIQALESLLGASLSHQRQESRDAHKRVIGWWCLVRTPFTVRVGEWCRRHAAQLPVISHDTILWAHARIEAAPVARVNMAPFGWAHSRRQVAVPAWTPPRHARVALDLLPKPSENVVIEVGAHQGHSSVAFAASPRVDHLTVVDSWEESPQDSAWRATRGSIATLSQEDHDSAAWSCMAILGDRAEICRMDSVAYAARPTRRAFDLAYIDAAHDAQSVANDLRAYSRLVAPGGVLCGHDYGHRRFPGVQQEVDRWAREQNLALQLHPETVWSVRMPS